MGSLFLEPSTRTRLSFEAAMHRLGGRVITSADPKSSSAAKGETLADTVRMVDAYADLIVLRHPAAGAARCAAKYARGPVINAGDGGREHPSQTLVDLYTLRREHGRLDGLTVLLYGDLRFGRTTHSLARALVRFGAEVLALCEPGLDLPESVVSDAAAGAGTTPETVELAGLEAVFAGARPIARRLRRRGAAAAPGNVLRLEDGCVDAVYATRVQRERLPAGRDASRLLPPIDLAFLAARPFRRAVVLHPLPRVDEIHPDVDRDPRAAYFRQAAGGVPVRMALLSYLIETPAASGAAAPPEAGVSTCGAAHCITTLEPASAPPETERTAGGGLRCAYCETSIKSGDR